MKYLNPLKLKPIAATLLAFAFIASVVAPLRAQQPRRDRTKEPRAKRSNERTARRSRRKSCASSYRRPSKRHSTTA